MPTNIELQKQVSDLRAELTTLKEILDRTFRNAGLSNDWYQAKAVNRPAPAEVTPHEVAPAPTSVSGSRIIREMVLKAKNEATGLGESK